jgi:hypothetical protein
VGIVLDDDGVATAPGLGGMLPDGAVASVLNQVEPLIDPDTLARQFILVPLVSGIRDPMTGEYHVLTHDDLKRFISRAVASLELKLTIDITQKAYEERMAYDRQDQDSFGAMWTLHSPIAEVTRLEIQTTDGQPIWTVPGEWIARGNFHQGMINILPFAVSSFGAITLPSNSAVGAGLLPTLFRQSWVEGFWRIQYLCGYPEGKIPTVVNELIGYEAAIKVLSLLASTFARSNSQSLSIDGLSQSQSGPGPEMFKSRIDWCEKERDEIMRKVQRLYGRGFVVGDV